jgi:hypothetical protein
MRGDWAGCGGVEDAKIIVEREKGRKRHMQKRTCFGRNIELRRRQMYQEKQN